MSTTSEPNGNSPNGLENGNGTAESSLLTADALDIEQQRRLAGLDEVEAESALLPTEYSIDLDRPTPKEKTAKDKPGLQSLFVLIMVGGVVGIVCLFVFAIGLGGNRSQPAQKPDSTKPEPVVGRNREAELEAKIAFLDQQLSLQRQQQAKPAQPTPVKSPQPTPVATPPAAVPPPAPRTIAYTPPFPDRSFTPAPARTASAQAAPPVDPFQRWNQLAQLGTAQGSFTPEATPTTASESPAIAAESSDMILSSAQPTQSQAGILLASSQISSVTIGQAPTSENRLSAGAQGILNHTSYQQAAASEPKSVLIGTATAGRVAMPMLWDGVSNSPGLQRFTVELTQPLLAADGTIALPAGTLFVAEAHQVAEGNNMVVASAVAVLYKDHTGTLQQQILQPGTVLIRGSGGTALIAEKVHDSGGAIAGQDLLVGVLSSLGRIGEIVNQPREQTVTTGVGFSQTSTRSDPEVWAAALDGFFGVTADRLRERSDEMVDEMLARPNVRVLPENTEVAIVVNSFLQVDR